MKWNFACSAVHLTPASGLRLCTPAQVSPPSCSPAVAARGVNNLQGRDTSHSSAQTIPSILRPESAVPGGLIAHLRMKSLIDAGSRGSGSQWSDVVGMEDGVSLLEREAASVVDVVGGGGRRPVLRAADS